MYAPRRSAAASFGVAVLQQMGKTGSRAVVDRSLRGESPRFIAGINKTVLIQHGLNGVFKGKVLVVGVQLNGKRSNALIVGIVSGKVIGAGKVEADPQITCCSSLTASKRLSFIFRI